MRYKGKVIGVYPVILFKVRIRTEASAGGHFSGWESDCPEIWIGLDMVWKDVVDVLVHELTELFLTMRRHRYTPAPDVGEGHDGYLFSFNHSTLSELSRFVGHGLCEICEDLHKEYKRYQKEKEKGGGYAGNGKK